MRWGWCALGVWLGSAAWGSPSDWEWLWRAEEALHRVAHEGVLLSWIRGAEGGITSEVRIWCDGEGRWRREHIAGPRRGLVVLSDGKHLYHRPPGAWVWLRQPLEQESPSQRHQRRALLQKNYRLEVGEPVILAARGALPLTLSPLHPGNPSRRFWVDRETFLFLRQEYFDSQGHLFSWDEYRQVRWGPVEAALFRPPPEEQVRGEPLEALRSFARREEVEKVFGLPLILPRYLPPGYQVSDYWVRLCPDGVERPVVRFQDGLNVLTLFERQFPPPPPRRGWGPWGPRGLHRGPPPPPPPEPSPQKTLFFSRAGRHFQLVGDLPWEELERIARSCP